jgi:NitT/TauT family transport system substrate-binding protein
MRRNFGWSWVAFAVALLPMQQAVAQAQEVKLNEVLRSLFYAPQYVALSLGAFDQEGIKIVGPKTTWGSQATVTEIVSGNSHIALVGPEAPALTLEASPERRMVNFAQLTKADGSFIIAKKPMPNFKIADLKGKTIVTSGVGSTPALVLVDLVKKAGLDPKKDVTIRNIPVSANIIPAFLDPSADFAQAFEPAVIKVVNEKKAHRAASVGTLFGTVPYTGYAATASFIEKNPRAVQSFTNAIYRGLLWTNSHSPKEIAKAVAPYFNDVPAATVEDVIAEYKKVNIWATDPMIEPEGLKRIVNLLVDGGVLKQGVAYEKIVDPQFARKAMQTVKK